MELSIENKFWAYVIIIVVGTISAFFTNLNTILSHVSRIYPREDGRKSIDKIIEITFKAPVFYKSVYINLLFGCTVQLASTAFINNHYLFIYVIINLVLITVIALVLSDYVDDNENFETKGIVIFAILTLIFILLSFNS